MTARFHIKENSIWDRNKGDKRLNLLEICTTLNALDCIADKNVDEYSYIQGLECENEQLRKENEKLESLWEDKCIKEYMKIVGENALQEMHNEKYGDK